MRRLDPGAGAVAPAHPDPLLAALADLIANRVAARLQNGRTPEPEDRLLDVPEAAARLGVTVSWLKRNANGLPFVKRLGRRTIRYSASGIQKWLSRGGR